MLRRRAYLGVELPPDVEAFEGGAMIIAGVLAGGMAEAARLQAGDRVIAIAGRRVADLCELGAALRGCGANDAVELVMALSQGALEMAIDSLDLVATFVGNLGSHSPPLWEVQLEPCR